MDHNETTAIALIIGVILLLFFHEWWQALLIGLAMLGVVGYNIHVRRELDFFSQGDELYCDEDGVPYY